jgi:hypothetical protein
MSYIGPPLSAEELEARGRRSWEEATREELERMTAKDRKLYAEERAVRAELGAYIATIRHRGAGASPDGTLATAAVTHVANRLGAIACATETGRPRILEDGSAVAYYRERWRSPDLVEVTAEPAIDPLLEELADALGCEWRWRGERAIELEPVEADDGA